VAVFKMADGSMLRTLVESWVSFGSKLYGLVECGDIKLTPAEVSFVYDMDFVGYEEG
jgi:hypothetical protein